MNSGQLHNREFILKYYRTFLKLAGQINWYNYRSYSVRKIQYEFRSKIE